MKWRVERHALPWKGEEELINGYNPAGQLDHIPAFSTNPTDARLLLDEIKRRGREYAFTVELRCIVEPQLDLDDWELHWGLISATPEQIARAFVEVMGDVPRSLP